MTKNNPEYRTKPGLMKLGFSGRPLALLGMIFLLLLAAACDDGSGSSSGTGTTATDDLLAQQQYGGQYAGGTATGDTEAGAAFAQWVLEQDPSRQIMTDAVVRGEQSLGVKVQPNVSKADVQRLLVALTQGMARTFPNKPLQVIAFYQSGDKLAEANYDRSTNQVNVQFAQ